LTTTHFFIVRGATDFQRRKWIDANAGYYHIIPTVADLIVLLRSGRLLDKNFVINLPSWEIWRVTPYLFILQAEQKDVQVVTVYDKPTYKKLRRNTMPPETESREIIINTIEDDAFFRKAGI